MINKRRGDVGLTLAGEVWELRPSFEALVGFEDVSGKSVVKCYADILNGNLRVTDIVHLIYAGAMAHPDFNKKINVEMIGGLVMKEGAVNVTIQGMSQDNDGSLSSLGEFVHNIAYGEKSSLIEEVVRREKEGLEDGKKPIAKTSSEQT